MRVAVWRLVDTRTGKRASVVSYFTEEQAWRALGNVRRNVERGRRPDLIDLLPHLGVAERT